MMNLAGLLMLQPDLDVACSASDLAQSTTTSSSLRASARGSYNFITPELDMMAFTSSYFILTVRARNPRLRSSI
jgi:hypothetical protein